MELGASMKKRQSSSNMDRVRQFICVLEWSLRYDMKFTTFKCPLIYDSAIKTSSSNNYA